MPKTLNNCEDITEHLKQSSAETALFETAIYRILKKHGVKYSGYEKIDSSLTNLKTANTEKYQSIDADIAALRSALPDAYKAFEQFKNERNSMNCR